MLNPAKGRQAIGNPPAGGAVLIYEDDEICAQAFASVLRHAGHTVQITSHFQPALAALEAKFQIDVLLADVIFPDGGVNGMALARMGRMQRPNLRVIFVTGQDLGEATHMADGPILRKPVPAKALLANVRQALTKGDELWWL